MGNIRQSHSLQRLRSPLFPFPTLGAHHGTTCTRRFSLRRHAPEIMCALFLLASMSALAQCPTPSAPLQVSAESQATVLDPGAISPHQDLRSSVMAHKHYKCQDEFPSRRLLSKEDLLELRRAVREHARNNPLHNAP